MNVVNEVLLKSFDYQKVYSTDEELIEQILLGETRLYEIIIRRHNTQLYRTGISIVKNDTEVEDVMQNCYVVAFKNLSSFEGRSKFTTWLTRIMINESLAYVNDRNRRTRLFASETESASHEPQELRTPEHKMINNELKVLLENSITNLPESLSTVYMLREVQQLSIAETANSLNISEANVKVRLHRAKEIMKNDLLEKAGEATLFEFLLDRCDPFTNKVMNIIVQYQ